MRRIAHDYKKMGEDKLFWKYNGKALSLGLHKYKQNPLKISNNLRLARTYRQRGDYKNADHYAKRSHEIALERAENKPYSDHAAYWLGKTAAETDDDALALEQYCKAFELKPGKTKYRKACFKFRKRMRQQQEN